MRLMIKSKIEVEDRVPPRATECHECGESLPSAGKECPTCGEKVSKQAQCPASGCGKWFNEHKGVMHPDDPYQQSFCSRRCVINTIAENAGTWERNTGRKAPPLHEPKEPLKNSITSKAISILHDMLKAVVDHEKLVQHEYERAHQRIHEARKYGGDAAASTVERIKGITNPHKLVGTYHACSDHGMGDAAKLCKERLQELHGRRVKSFPAPSKKVRVQVGRVRKTEPDAPKPQKGQSLGDYHRAVFHHYRKLGRSHAQAHAIAYSMKERAAEEGHQFSKSLDRPDMVGPRPLQPPTQDRSLTHMREEPSRSVVPEQAPLPVTRPGASGAHAPAPPQPALVINKALISIKKVPANLIFHPKPVQVSDARATTLHNQAHEESITEHHAKVETHENRVHSSDDPTVKMKHRRAVNFHKNAITAHHAAREAFGTKGYEQASDRAFHATDLANTYSMRLEDEGRARKSLELLLTKAVVNPRVKLPDPSKPGHVRLSPAALQHHLKHGTYSLVSAGRNGDDPKEEPMHENHPLFRERHKQLKADLDKHGYAYTEVSGKWGSRGERSFMVYHKPHAEEGTGNSYVVHHKGPNEFAHIRELGKKYNQSAVIHSHQGNHECHYVTGESAGQHQKGTGHEMKPEAEDNYTEVSHPHRRASRFALHFGDEKHPMDSAVLKSILERMAKAQIIRMPPETANINLQPEPTKGVSYPTQVVARDRVAKGDLIKFPGAFHAQDAPVGPAREGKLTQFPKSPSVKVQGEDEVDYHYRMHEKHGRDADHYLDIWNDTGLHPAHRAYEAHVDASDAHRQASSGHEDKDRNRKALSARAMKATTIADRASKKAQQQGIKSPPSVTGKAEKSLSLWIRPVRGPVAGRMVLVVRV